MSSYRRHATHKDAAERALRQVLRHRMETNPFEWIVAAPPAVEKLRESLAQIRASLENWPVHPPLFLSQALPPNHDVVGCTGAWKQYGSGRRKCSDCGEEMNPGPKPQPRVVGYWYKGSDVILRCLDHPPPEGYGIPVTSEDLESGGMCTYPDCGNDLLAHPGVNQ